MLTAGPSFRHEDTPLKIARIESFIFGTGSRRTRERVRVYANGWLRRVCLRPSCGALTR